MRADCGVYQTVTRGVRLSVVNKWKFEKGRCESRSRKLNQAEVDAEN